MNKCVSSNYWFRSTNPAELLGQLVKNEIGGLELCFSTPVEIAPAVEVPPWPGLLEEAKQKGLKICSLTTNQYDIFSLASDEEHIINSARQYFNQLLDLAQQLGPDIRVVIPAHITTPLGEVLTISYENAFNQLFQSLEKLADAVNLRSVYLALENPGSGFLLSPLELRQLIDEINSPWVGVCFNPNQAQRLASPLDWLTILDKRVSIIHIPGISINSYPDNKYTAADRTTNSQEAITTYLQKSVFTGPVVFQNL